MNQIRSLRLMGNDGKTFRQVCIERDLIRILFKLQIKHHYLWPVSDSYRWAPGTKTRGDIKSSISLFHQAPAEFKNGFSHIIKRPELSVMRMSGEMKINIGFSSF